MSERGKRGAAESAKRFERDFDPDRELPPLDSIEAAARWYEVIGRAVSTERISDRSAAQMNRAVDGFVKAQGALNSEDAERLRSLLTELRKRSA